MLTLQCKVIKVLGKTLSSLNLQRPSHNIPKPISLLFLNKLKDLELNLNTNPVTSSFDKETKLWENVGIERV